MRLPDITTEKLNEISARLHTVTRDIHLDPELRSEVARLAMEGLTNCTDRTDFCLGQMEDAALLSRLTRGEIDQVDLYNHGISFFRLNEVHAQTGMLSRHMGGIRHEGIQDYLAATYYLQGELQLPNHQPRPRFLDSSFITRQIATHIADAVKERTIANDGEHVVDFMSTWKPWVKHVKQQPEHQPDFALLTQLYQDALSDREDARAREGSLEHGMNEERYRATVDGLMHQLADWESQLVGQKTREFLVNHRADFIAESAQPLPAYFG